jgi:hypothetical protein
MNSERFVERMLETENLTDELEDAQAQRLLDWGIAQVEPLVRGIEDAEIAGERVNGLMALIRKINRLAAVAQGSDPQLLAAELAVLNEVTRSIYPAAPPLAAQACLPAAEELAALDPAAALEFIIAWPGCGQGVSEI